MTQPTFVLGGYQTDFAENWTANGSCIYELLAAAVVGALETTGVPAADVDVAHIGNLAGELFCGQAQLGGMVATVDPPSHRFPQRAMKRRARRGASPPSPAWGLTPSCGR